MADEAISMDEAAEKVSKMDLLGEGIEDEDQDEDQDDEDQDDTDEDESEEETDEDESDEEEGEGEQEKFEVTLYRDDAGNPVKGHVTRDELIAGWQRGKGFEAKMQEAVEARKAAQQEQQAIRQVQEEYKRRLEMWAVPADQEPDWQLAAQQLSPQEFNLARAQWEAKQRRSQAARDEYQRLAEYQRQQDAALARENVAKAKDRLLEAVPEWRDANVAKKDIQEIIEVGRSEYNLTPEELSELADDRFTRILRDAALYQRMRKNNATIEKRVSPAGKTLRPGGKTTAKQKSSRKQNEAMARFNKTNSMDDAVAALSGLLDDF